MAKIGIGTPPKSMAVHNALTYGAIAVGIAGDVDAGRRSNLTWRIEIHARHVLLPAGIAKLRARSLGEAVLAIACNSLVTASAG